MVINSTRTWRVRHCQTVFKTKAYPYIHTHIHLYINLSLYTSIHIYTYIHTYITHILPYIPFQDVRFPIYRNGLEHRDGRTGLFFFLVLYYMICIFDGDGRRLCVIKMTPMDGCGRHIKKGFPDIFFVFCSVDVVCICLC